MRSNFRTLLGAGFFFLGAVAASAQSAANPVPPPQLTVIPTPSADAEWLSLLESRNADAVELSASPLQGVGQAAARAKRASKHSAAADKAKEFYASHPAHPQAAEARRLEILSLVQAEENGAAATGNRLDKLVADYRTDSTVAASQRALGAGAFELSRAMRAATTHSERLTAMERAARGLLREFPTEAPGYEALLAVAEASPTDASSTLAAELAAASAPASVKKSAQILSERYALLGRALREQLTIETIDLVGKMRAGEPIVVYSWASWAPGSIELGKMIQARRFNAIAVCLDADLPAAKSVQKKYNLGGEHVYDEKGTLGALAVKLRYSAPGQIYLVDVGGVIREVRGGEDLERKLRDLGFKTPPIAPPSSNH